MKVVRTSGFLYIKNGLTNELGRDLTPRTPRYVVQSIHWREGMPLRGIFTGLCKLHAVQWGQVQDPSPGEGQCQAQIQDGKWANWEQPCREGLKGQYEDLKIHMTWQPVLVSQKDYCLLQQGECGNQVKGGGLFSSTMLLWGPAWSSAFCSGAPSTRRTWTSWRSLEKGHRNQQQSAVHRKEGEKRHRAKT